MTFIKNFTGWFKLKPKLDLIQASIFFQEREVWNCHVGANVGFEIDGKNQDHIRPVLVFKKLSHNTFLGIPLTTKIKDGSWYSPSNVAGVEGRFILAQIRVFDSKRLHSLLAKITTKELKAVKADFISLIS